MSETNLALTEVEKLVADETTIVCRGETFKLKAFGIRKLQRAMPHIAVIHSLLQLINDQAEDDMGRMFALVTHGGDALLELIGLALDRKLEWFDEADPFEVAAVALAVAKVNIDFFGNAQSKLTPLKQQAAALMQKVKG